MTPDVFLLAPAAFIAGILMFLAPCTLPIVPSYLIFIAGASAEDKTLAAKIRRRRIFINALAFVIGFSLVFILFGVFAAGIGSLLGEYRAVIARLAGVVIIVFGLSMLGALRLPVFSSEWHAKLPAFVRLGRPESSFAIGALFALGWSPCIGPILGTVLLFASNSSTALGGALLLGVFSLGLALPFLLTALFIDAAGGMFVKWERGVATLSIIGGALLILLGILILFGAMGSATAWGYTLFDRFGYTGLYRYF